MMQSDGSELGVAEGYEQTSMRSPPSSVALTQQVTFASVVRHAGVSLQTFPVWAGFPANGCAASTRRSARTSAPVRAILFGMFGAALAGTAVLGDAAPNRVQSSGVRLRISRPSSEPTDVYRGLPLPLPLCWCGLCARAS